MKVSRRAIRKAISIIEDSKQSHVDAIQEPKNQILGDKAFHKRCVQEYEQVLRVLRLKSVAMPNAVRHPPYTSK